MSNRILISIPYYGDPKNLDYESCGPGVRECLNSKEHDFKLNISNGTYIQRNRNTLVLTSDSWSSDGWIDLNNYKIKECDYFLFIDHDIKFTLNDVKNMISKNVENVGLPYKKRGTDEYNVIGYKHSKSMVKVKGQGMGCRLIKRSVFEKIKPFWFEMPTLKNGSKIKDQSEDFDFDSKCRCSGIDVWSDFKNPVEHKIGATKMEQKQITPGQLARSINTSVNNLADMIDTLNNKVIELTKENEELKSKLKD